MRSKIDGPLEGLLPVRLELVRPDNRVRQPVGHHFRAGRRPQRPQGPAIGALRSVPLSVVVFLDRIKLITTDLLPFSPPSVARFKAGPVLDHDEGPAEHHHLHDWRTG